MNNHDELTQIFAEFEPLIQNAEDRIYGKAMSLEQQLLELDTLRGHCERPPFAGLLSLNLQNTQTLCTRVAALFFKVLADSSARLDLRTTQYLCLQKRFVSQVFEASGFYGLQSLVALMDRQATALDEKRKLPFLENPARLRKLMVTPLGELDTQDLVSLSLEDSETVALITLGLLLDRAPLNVNGEANRKFLLEEFNPYGKLSCNKMYRHLVANVWMLSSYSTAERKHETKKHLNDWFERYLKSKNIGPRKAVEMRRSVSGDATAKPTLVMVAESFKSVHAMFRWYGPLIKRMREDYRMVLLALPDDIDENARALFDQTIEVPADELSLQPVLDQVSPDIVYFPSVGMRAWAIALANLRWAPLQIMSLGHPATSHSRHMDVCLCGERLFGGQQLFSENVLILNTEIGNLSATHQNMALPEAPVLPEDEIRIAVPCHVMKLNFLFIAALKEIERMANKRVRFTFFPNEQGVGHVSITQRIRNFFPSAVVARRAGYEQYLRLLNEHHIALSPFPFGNASSIIDCLVLNLPIVGLLGQEPHARSDYTVLGAFGLDEYLVADSIENYVQGAARYINSPELLQELRAMVASKNVLSKQFNDATERPDEIRRAIAWAWKNREELNAKRASTFYSEGRW